jgi:hypothetical protein
MVSKKKVTAGIYQPYNLGTATDRRVHRTRAVQAQNGRTADFMKEAIMGTTVVLEDIKASELPAAWRRRVKAKANEVLTVTIAKRKTKTAAKTAKKPNATFGMWADRADANDPAAYVRALRQPRATSQRSAD